MTDEVETKFNFARDLKERWDTGDQFVRRGIINQLGSDYILKDRKVSISLHLPLVLLERNQKDILALDDRLGTMRNAVGLTNIDAYLKKTSNWGGRRDLNPQPPVPQTSALTS